MDNGGKKEEEMDIGERKDEKREEWASARAEQWVGRKSTGREGENHGRPVLKRRHSGGIWWHSSANITLRLQRLSQ